MSYTVIFAGSPRQVDGNPMSLATPFGEVEAISVGSSLEQIEIMEAALEDIAEGGGPASEKAQEALLDAAKVMLRGLQQPKGQNNERR